MSRRSSRNTEAKDIDTEEKLTVVTPTATPKKVRKAVKTEAVEVVVSAEKPSAKSRKKVKAESESDEDIEEPAPKSKASGVKAKAKIGVEEPDPKPKKVSAKRKAKTEEDDNEETDDKKIKKKRKTKEVKGSEEMPLAARTAVGTLKKTMHIGAHVSAAGGKLQTTIDTVQQLIRPVLQAYKTRSTTVSTSAVTRSHCFSNLSENGPVPH